MPQFSFRSVRLPLGPFPEGRFSDIHAYWERQRRGYPYPARRDIDPVDIPWALPWICLIDVEREPMRLRYRLEGTGLSAVDRQPLTGKLIDEIRPPDYAEMVRRHLTEVAETGVPSLHAIEIVVDYRAMSYCRMALPLSTSGTEVGMILTYGPWSRVKGLDEAFEHLLE